MSVIQTEMATAFRDRRAALTERQLRERAYYAEFCRRRSPDSVDFAPVRNAETRPWNSYWYVYEFVRRFRRQENSRKAIRQLVQSRGRVVNRDNHGKVYLSDANHGVRIPHVVNGECRFDCFSQK